MIRNHVGFIMLNYLLTNHVGFIMLNYLLTINCAYSSHYFGETNTILIFITSYKFICVGVPEWLSGMTRNHVGFARTRARSWLSGMTRNHVGFARAG